MELSGAVDKAQANCIKQSLFSIFKGREISDLDIGLAHGAGVHDRNIVRVV